MLLPSRHLFISATLIIRYTSSKMQWSPVFSIMPNKWPYRTLKMCLLSPGYLILVWLGSSYYLPGRHSCTLNPTFQSILPFFLFKICLSLTLFAMDFWFTYFIKQLKIDLVPFLKGRNKNKQTNEWINIGIKILANEWINEWINQSIKQSIADKYIYYK